MSSPFGSLAAMAATPQLQRMMGGVGMIPMGMGHDQNVYDRLMNQRFTALQMQAITMAAESDKENYFKSFRGMAAMTGTPFGAEQRRAATSLAGAAATMSPLLTEFMPDFMDQLGGTRGSAAVMAKRMIDAGRYRADPVTGRMGMGAESVGAISRQLYGELYSPEHTPAMRGVSAGQVGSLFNELQMRGMVGTAAAERRYAGIRGDDPHASTMRALDEMRSQTPNLLAQAARNTGVNLGKPGAAITPEDLDKLSLDPGVADKMRIFDATRIKRSVKSYVDAISAMREIFGDAGKPNAPMAELVRGLEALTLGGMSQMDPARLATTVRQTYNLAKQTGVGIDNVLMMQQHAASRAAAMGIEPAFAVQATQGALAFGGAYNAQGHAQYTAWGAMGADQLKQLDLNMRVQAAASPIANRLGVLARLSESAGGFDPNTKAGQLMQAVRDHATTFGPNGQSILVGDREFMGIMTSAKTLGGRSAGISEGDVRMAMGQTTTNREYVERFGMMDSIRDIQGPQELHKFIGGSITGGLTARLRDVLVKRGLKPAEAFRQARALSAGISQRISERTHDLSTEEFSDKAQREEAMGKIISEEMNNAGRGDILGGMAAGDRQNFLHTTADILYGKVNRDIQGNPLYAMYGNWQNEHRLTNKTVQDGAMQQKMMSRFTTDMQEAMSPLGKGSMLQRSVDALQGAGPDDNGLAIVAKALGGVSMSDINTSMMPQFRSINDKRKKLTDLQSEFSRTTDPTQRRIIQEKMNVQIRELKAETTGLAKTAEQFGVFNADALSHDDITRGLRSSIAATSMMNETVGVRGNFGAEVTEGHRREFAATALTREDQIAIAVGRRQYDVDQIAANLAGKGGPLTPGQTAALTRAIGIVSPSMAGLNAQQINQEALRLMRDQVTGIGEQEITAVTKGNLSANDSAVGILGRRSRVPYTPTAAQVAAVQLKYPEITQVEAYEYAKSELTAARLGVSPGAIDAQVATRPDYYKGPSGRSEAISDIYATRAAQQFDVSEADIDKWAKGAPRAPDATEIAAYKAKFKLDENMSPDDVKRRMYKDAVLLGRQAAANDRFGRFMASDEGRKAREVVEQAHEDAGTVAQKLLSPQMTQRLGTQAIEIGQALQKDQQLLKALAVIHTGGDVTKLLMNPGGNIPWNDPDAREKIAGINTAIAGVNERKLLALFDLDSRASRPGRQYQLGDEMDASRAVLDRENMTPEARKEMLSKLPSEQKMYAVTRLQQERSTMEYFKQVTGITNPLFGSTDTEMARYEGVRFGAGNVMEAKLLYGRERWDKLSDADKQTTLAKMRTGLGTTQAAQTFLGIKDADMNDENQQRVSAVAFGLSSAKHAEQLLGVDPSKLTPEQRAVYDKNYEAVFKGGGIAGRTAAMKSMGLIDPLSPEIRAKVEAERVLAGDKLEALSLMGKKPGDALGLIGSMQLGAMTAAVGQLRGLPQGDDEAILKSTDPKLAGVQAVIKRQRDRQREAQREQDMTPAALSRQILADYHFTVTDIPGDMEKKLSGLIEGEGGRGMAHMVIASGKNIRDLAKRDNMSVRDLTDAYYQAKKDKSLDKFRADHRLDKGAYETLERSIQVQEATGFLGLEKDADRGAFRTKGAGDAVEYFRKSLSTPGAGAGAGTGVPTRMELSGSVTLKGDQLDLVGAWGAGRQYLTGAAPT